MRIGCALPNSQGHAQPWGPESTYCSEFTLSVLYWDIYGIYLVYTVHMLRVCVKYIVYNMNIYLQGTSCAPSLDVMLLKQQVFTASGANNRQEETFEYAFRLSHPLLQFLPKKLSEWITKNLADKLELPPTTGPGDDWGSEDLKCAFFQIRRAITCTPLTLWSLNQTCIAVLCALAATLSI